ncbi:DUF3829 domain-containing protein [Aureimonas sp. AU20]|uniref:DUF3829 domain-containing protein n=1 Tax=Aureimonas sp. AU20 TaxID=1349819 RepID=UPI00071EF641|nr:DUF3829 domain-containing protein [Aureimonas sp. AU20]ALN72564.1 hypothetical protein M673_07545 [Aureimonas sp. AU20]
MPILKQVAKIVLALIVLAIVFVAKGGDVPSLLRDIGLPEAARSGAEPSADNVDDLATKLGAFVTCINRVDAAMRANYDRYRQSFPAAFEGGPILHRSFKIAPYEVDNGFSRDCAAGLRAAGRAAPHDPALDDLGLLYADALEALVPVLNRTDDYLGQETYRDDDWHEMRADLHPRLLPLFGRFLDVSDRMREVVAAANLASTRLELVEIERREGRAYRWHALNLIHQARLSFDETRQAIRDGKVRVPDVVKAERALEDALQDARTYMSAHSSVTTSLGNKPVLFHIGPRAADLLAAIKTVRRNTAHGDPGTAEADLDNMTEALNGLVDDFNMRAGNGQ